MATVLIVAYLLIVVAMIVVILLQRSEGGGLGMGGGGGNFMSARGSANLLTRTTAILGTLFMLTAIGLTVLSQTDRGSSSILSQAAQNPDGSRTTVLDALDALGTGDLNVPQQPAAPADDLTIPAAPVQTDLEAPAAPSDLQAPEAPASVEQPAADAPAAEDPADNATNTPGN